MPLFDDFRADNHGRRFTDVMQDSRIDFGAVVAFFEDQSRQERMEHSEMWHKRPALAGVVVELEALPFVSTFLSSHDGRTTTRFRQAVGVLVRIIMENREWKTTGRKGSLGRRVKVATGTATPGAYRNDDTGLAKWFTRAEHYKKTTQDKEAVSEAPIKASNVPNADED